MRTHGHLVAHKMNRYYILQYIVILSPICFFLTEKGFHQQVKRLGNQSQEAGGDFPIFLASNESIPSTSQNFYHQRRMTNHCLCMSTFIVICRTWMTIPDPLLWEAFKSTYIMTILLPYSWSTGYSDKVVRFRSFIELSEIMPIHIFMSVELY